jgi:8-oxo-dGTP diphosphatase
MITAMKIVAKALLYNNRGEILILKRGGTHPNFPHHIDFPGGEVESGEEEAAAVAREIDEETGLTVPTSSLQCVLTKQIDDETKHLVYIGSIMNTDPKIVLSWEHEAFKWLSPEELVGQPIPAGVDSYYMTALSYLRDVKTDD